MQSKEELEIWYTNPDPWNYTTNNDDAVRKQKILMALKKYAPYHRAIDIGCGEGWITQHLPAAKISGIEIADTAASRFPLNVTRVYEPQGKYDLVCTMGTLYKQYDNAQIFKWIIDSSSRHILIAGIKDWLIPYDFGKIIHSEEYTYREYAQSLRIYEVSP